MTKTRLTKAELQDQLEAANTKSATLDFTINNLKSGRVPAVILGGMIGMPIATIGEWLKDGLPSSRYAGELFPFVQLSDLISWLEHRAAQKERDNRKVAEDLLLGEIADLKSQISLLTSVPPALPQAVVDILDDANELAGDRLEYMFDLLADEAVRPGFLDDEKEVTETVRDLGVLQSRIRAALAADFEWHGKERLAVSQARLAETLKTTAAANEQLAKDLTA